MESPLSHS